MARPDSPDSPWTARQGCRVYGPGRAAALRVIIFIFSGLVFFDFDIKITPGNTFYDQGLEGVK